MKTLFKEYKIDYIIHGDDPCLLPDGTDAYALAKKAGRYKQIKRTEGVSSTDIVGTISFISLCMELKRECICWFRLLCIGSGLSCFCTMSTMDFTECAS